MKLSDAFDMYERYITIEGQSPRTIEHSRYVKKRIIDVVGDKKLAHLCLDDVYRWKSSMLIGRLPNGQMVKRSANSLRCDILRLRAMLKYMGLIGEKCLDYELVPVPKREDVQRTFLHEDEVTTMIDCACSLRNKFIISLLYSSGIRLSELLSLDRNSIQNRTFNVVGKGKKLRLCFIDERTEKLMEQYLATRHDNCPALVVSHLYKQRLTASTVQLIIRNTAKRAGMDKRITPHVFRHSFATNFISNNGGVKPLSELLGHRSLDTTSIYTHLINNELARQYEQFHTF
jgi:site-specific recombinase XerD